MKTLVVYFSYTGNCGLVAGVIKNSLGAETLELKLEDDKERKGLAKYFWGGKQVFSHAKPPLKPYKADWEQYDLIVIGSPVWAGSFSPALATFLDQTKISGKKIALFCCHRGGKGRVFDQLKAALTGNTVVAERGFIIPSGANRGEALENVRAWAQSLSKI
ncbi:MAG: NAD(P)H-dependent oxidoreductase [Treponema sp.]|jgi:flavodoxin|nr:NAD(P)H-dependent oxidoreductase [Treponema sp.]